MEFSRQEYWSELPFPSPGDLPDTGIQSVSPTLASRFFTICSAKDRGSIPGSGRSPGEGNDYPLQYSCLENSMDSGAWRATVHGICRVRHRATNRHTQDQLSLNPENTLLSLGFEMQSAVRQGFPRWLSDKESDCQ